MKPRNTAETSIKVPLDILTDVLGIVVKESLKHEVTQVIESRSLIIISIFLDNASLRQEVALKNIQTLLQEYNEFRYSENEELNWKEY